LAVSAAKAAWEVSAASTSTGKTGRAD
jgi:hypothetical protein